MTGTANEVFDCNNEIAYESINRSSSRIVQLTAWICGKVEADCILSDMTECGCSVLFPKKQAAPAEAFKLIIMSPDNDERVHSVLNSQICWQDENFTRSHKKIGIKFLDVTDDQRSEISLLENLFCNPDGQLIKCCLVIPPTPSSLKAYDG